MELYMKEQKSTYNSNTSKSTFIDALFTIAKPCVNQLMNKENLIIYIYIYIYIYKMECYSVIRKNEILLFAQKWMELEVVLTKIKQVQKDKYCMFSLICYIEN
jgi:hypothetical protein